MTLLPAPRQLRRKPGILALPRRNPFAWVSIRQTDTAPDHPEAYSLTITPAGITIEHRDPAGRRAALATLRQLLAQHGRRLPCLVIRDWPAFARRGVMLDVSRGRVPNLATLLDLAERLADFKINELQLYTEHTFAYRKFKSVWQTWGALTGPEIRRLDARCRELGIDLVPNQNSFGHLRYFLAHPDLKPLAEIPEPYEAETGDFLRRPTTLAPRHPGTLPFLRDCYDELLPNFTSRYFNIGADETWDLGKGQSQAACARLGQGRVYLTFLKQLHREVTGRGKTMMFWGDIILKYPDLIAQLPRDVIALNWGYEANHPFDRETAQFARAGIPFYVCPGTSTWQTLLGKHDNALKNLRAAAQSGQKHGALGYLVTDWGDGGHPQPLAVSWPLLAAGAAYAWNPRGVSAATLTAVLNRDLFADPTHHAARAGFQLGFTHRQLRVSAANETPLGTVIAAPRPADRELFCRNGLKWAARISPQHIRAALREIEARRRALAKSQPRTAAGKLLVRELDLAARMAAESCHYLLWQQAVAASRKSAATRLARRGLDSLKNIETEYTRLWPRRNKATPRHSVPFLKWRRAEYLEFLGASGGTLN